MKKNHGQVLIVLMSALTITSFFTACGSKKSDGQEFPQVVENRLEREWVQVGCTNNTSQPEFGASLKISFVLLMDQNLSRVETYYTGSKCTDPAVTVTYLGNYTKNAESDQDGNIDLNYDRVVVRPVNRSGVAALSTLKWCGQTEWYVGVDADITSSPRTSSCAHPTMPLTIENRYRVENEFLFLGSSALRTVNKRPTTVDRLEPYHCPCK